MIKAQVHNRFKIFTGKLDADNTINTIASEVSTWVGANKVAPKSIGIEYLEGSKRIVLSLGYRSDEAAYGVRLSCVHLGQVNPLDKDDLTELETEMTKASQKVNNIICHELYVTEKNDFMMVFMSHDAE